MDIKPYDKTIKELLISGRQFLIPRFQREYSWDKKNYQEFFDDMISNLTTTEGKLISNQYFLGTMLFVGNYSEGTDQEILVVDGQQRLTTITILFSALSDNFIRIKEDTLSDQIFKYIMTKDDNGDEVRILKSKTHYPFFAYFIQSRNKDGKQEACTEEEFTIQEAYNYFMSQLIEDKIRSQLKRGIGSDVVEQIKYTDILKALRDQVLGSTFISISMNNRINANKIFEILNAKGKRLAYIDLIKNRIFEVIKSQEPADFAEDRWQKIKDTLNSGKETEGFATFYRHFWVSTYQKALSSKLYDNFLSYITPKSEERYKKFLDEILTNVKIYMKILNPQRDDYDNRKEYFWLVQSLNTINNYFNVVQVRIALLALFDVKDRGLLSHDKFKKTVLYLENFHFAYNAILTGRSNRLEQIYSSFATSLRKCTDKGGINSIIKDKLIKPLDILFPLYQVFCDKFVRLSYSKKDSPLNVKAKYAINRINCVYSGVELFPDDGSIEHIFPESSGGESTNIGNLIMLEGQLNEDAGQKKYEEKRLDYEKSKYPWIQKFIADHQNWHAEDIGKRAEQLAFFYYTEVFKMTVSQRGVSTSDTNIQEFTSEIIS